MTAAELFEDLTDARLTPVALAALLSGPVADVPDSLAQRLVAEARPAVRFAVKPMRAVMTTVGASRFGGDPDLPPEVAWPTWTNPDGDGSSRPLGFYAQINLTGLASWTDVPLPTDGLLSFFVDFTDEDGFCSQYGDQRQGFRILYMPTGAELARRTAPAGAHRQPEALLRPVAVTTLPDFDSSMTEDEYEAWELADEEIEQYIAALVPAGYSTTSGRHQLGGHPRMVQNPLGDECVQAVHDVYRRVGEFDQGRWAKVQHESQRWQLLLQLDSDYALDVMYGDAGALYWALPSTDLASHRWDRAWCVFQCG